MSVNTAKVVGRRKLKFASYEEMLADAERVGSGSVRTLGNWSAGQIFRHLAAAYNASIDGFTITFPLPIRLMGRLFRKRLLSTSMPAGFQLPAKGAGGLVPPPTSTEEGLSALRSAVARLRSESRRVPHPALGAMTREEWDQVHLGHASLHLSFLVPD
jgi:Protein of unknown function (DUF1569)